MPHRWLALDAQSPIPRRPPAAGAGCRAAALRLRRAAARQPEPGPRRAAAHARTGARRAPGLARGRARAAARRPGRDPRLQPGQPVGPAPATGPSAQAAGAAQRAAAVPAQRGRVHRLPPPARLAAPAQLRSRGRAFRLLPAAVLVGEVALAPGLDRAHRRALVAGAGRGLLARRRQARARHAPGRPGAGSSARCPQAAPAVVAHSHRSAA